MDNPRHSYLLEIGGELRIWYTKDIMKTCNRCGETLEVGVNWPPSRAIRRDYSCSSCRNAHHKSWRKEHREEESTYRREWVKGHREATNAYMRTWMKEHREKTRAYRNAWKEKYPERREEENAKRRRYYANNPAVRERIRYRDKIWMREHREQVNERARRRRVMKRGADGSHTIGGWLALVEHCDNHCLVCGEPFTDDRPVTRDHIIPLIKGGGDESVISSLYV